MLEGLEVSEIKLSELEFSKRLDAEYYKKHFLKYENKIRENSNYIELSEDAKFLIGPFGSSFDTANYIQNGEYRYVRGQDVKPFQLKDIEKRYLPKDDYFRLEKYALKENDILISVVGTLGNACIVNKQDLPAIFSCKSTVIRISKTKPRYLLAFLNCKYGRELLLRKERGAIQKGLNLEDLKTILVPKLGDTFQNEIENILLTASSRIDKSKQTYTQAETILLQEIGLNNFEPSKEAVNIKSFKNSFLNSGRLDAEYYQRKYEEIELVIRRNGVYTVSEVFELLSNPSPTNYIDSGTKVLKTKNIRIPTVEIEKITDYTNEFRELIQKNDLLFASMGVGSLGRISFVDKDYDNCTTDGTLRIFRAKDKFKNLCFEIPCLLFLTSRFGQELIYKYVIGSTGIISISKENVENLIFPKVPNEVAVRLTSIVMESISFKAESERLLGVAKKAVEMAIEESEEVAIKYLKDNTN